MIKAQSDLSRNTGKTNLRQLRKTTDQQFRTGKTDALNGERTEVRRICISGTGNMENGRKTRG